MELNERSGKTAVSANWLPPDDDSPHSVSMQLYTSSGKQPSSVRVAEAEGEVCQRKLDKVLPALKMSERKSSRKGGSDSVGNGGVGGSDSVGSSSVSGGSVVSSDFA